MTVLDDLLAKPDQQQILNDEVLPEMRSAGINTNDWKPGSLTRADAFTAAKLRAMTREQLAVLAATRFGDYLWGFVPLPDATPEEQADLLAWAPIIAKQAYGVDPIEATYTKRNIVLHNSTATVYNKLAGRVILVFPSGNRYVNDGPYISAGVGDVTVVFRSEFTVDATHAYADSASTSGITFLTADLPGVSATNPAATFAPVAQAGSGLGLVTPSGAPGSAHTIRAVILTSGNVGVGTWSVTIDGGAPTVGAIGVLANFGGSGITLTPSNNGGSPAFIKDTVYYIQNPGSDVTQVGRAAETPQELGTRVRAQYPLLAFTRDTAGNALPISPMHAAYQALVLTAFPEVKTCLVVTSATVNDTLNIYIAGEGALLAASTISAVDVFIKALGMVTDRCIVGSPSTQAITLAAGGITVRSAQAAAAKAEAQRRVSVYLAGVDPNSPLPYGGLIDRSYLISLIRTTPGVTHVDDALTINGAATDYQLAAATMATYAGDVGTSQTWTTV